MDRSARVVAVMEVYSNSIHNQYKRHQETELDLYVALHDNPIRNQLNLEKAMTALASLFHIVAAYLSAFSFAQLVRGVFVLSAMAGFFMFFRPLLTGIARALVLTVRPRLTRDQIAARRQARDARLLQRAIALAESPVAAVELRALAARA